MRKKVLAVDDQNTVLMLECMMLTAAGLDVVTARNGEEALTVAAAESPDLILLDATMPKMDGFVACRALRARPETMYTPIVMVTTRSEVNNIRLGFAAGCDEYVTKPFNAVELVSIVRRFLG
jgi:DNA-binding response OmpR family regulator